eukprot:3641406-Rhodomonas_salina.1
MLAHVYHGISEFGGGNRAHRRKMQKLRGGVQTFQSLPESSGGISKLKARIHGPGTDGLAISM